MKRWKNRYWDLRIGTERELRDQYNRLTKESLEKALINTDDKFAKTNEFREQQKDLIASKAGNTEIDMINKRMDEYITAGTLKISDISRTINEKIDHNDKNMRDFISIEVVKRISELEKVRSENLGKSEGISKYSAWILFILTLAGFIIYILTLKHTA